MASIVRNLVEGIGITPYEQLPKNPIFFTQLAIPETVEIPYGKPDIEDLMSVMVDAEVISARLINTPTAVSCEGQVLLGHKLVIELKLRQKVKYIANEPAQSIHAAYFEMVINSAFVVLPPGIGTTCMEELFKQNKLVVIPYIEDIYAVKLDRRRIFKNISLLIDVKVNS